MPTILSEPTVDKSKIVTWLAGRANNPSALVGAIYSALIERIKRGDFDSEVSE